MNKFKLYSITTLATLLLAACSSPKPPDVNPPAPPPAPPPPSASATLLEVTIDLRNNSATAKTLEPSGVRRQAATTVVSGNRGIELNQIATGLDDDDVNNVRYVYATFQVENNTGDNMNNLTLWALDAPTLSGSLSAPTKFGTMFSSVKDGAGNEIADGALVRSILPVHGVRNVLGEFKIDKKLADLQLINAPEQTEVEGQLNATYGITGAQALGFGYVARDFAGVARQIAATNGTPGGRDSCTADTCKGFVTVSFKLPFDPSLSREQRPFVFTSIFALGNQSNRFTSQSIEDQARPSIAGKATTDFRGTPRLLGGSSLDFYLASPQNLCQVTTAFTSGTFTDKARMPATLVTTAGKRDTCMGSGGALGLAYPSSGGVGNDFIFAKAAILDASDRLVVVGSHSGELAVWRFKNDGLDKSFSGDGEARFPAVGEGKGVALDANGKIVVVANSNTGGTVNTVVVRLDDDGTLDLNFGVDSVTGSTDGSGKETLDLTLDFPAVGVDVEDGFIYAASTYGIPGARVFGLSKLTDDGRLDPNFGNKTFSFTGKDAVATGIDVEGSDIYVVGSTSAAGSSDWAVINVLTTNGNLDLTFNGSGKLERDINTQNGGINPVSQDAASAVKVDALGNIIIGGTSGPNLDFAVARLTSGGSFDTAFGSNSDGVTISGLGGDDVASSMALMSDGSIVLGGHTNDASGVESFVARKFTSSGTASTIYEATSLHPLNNAGQDKATATLVNSAGQVILVGELPSTFTNEIAIIWYNP